MGGPPPEEWQCTAIRRLTRTRCRKWRLRGQKTCEFHGGRTGQKTGVRINHLPRFYSTQLKGTLKEFLDSVADEPLDDKLNLSEELDLFRHSSLPAVRLYELAVSTNKQELILEAARTMRQSLDDCSSLAERIVRMDAARKDKISIHHIDWIINQVIRCVYDALDGDDAQKLEQMIRTKVKLPKQGAEGTMVTPSDDVREMDDTVPRDE